MSFVGSLECLLGHCDAKREAVAVVCDMPLQEKRRYKYISYMS